MITERHEKERPLSAHVLSRQPLLVAVNFDWYSPVAAVVVMENLLRSLDPGEFVVVAARTSSLGTHARAVDPQMRVHPVLGPPSSRISWRIDEALRGFHFRLMPWARRALVSLARRYGCGAILAVYPDAYGVAAARRAARTIGLPLAVYLHDTIAEGTAGSPIHRYAVALQERLFVEDHLFFAMSEGLAELLLKKYGVRSVPLPHCYNEAGNQPMPGPAAEPPTVAFSGMIYGINRPATARVARAAAHAGYRITCTQQSAANAMIADGVPAGSVSVEGVPGRQEYLAHLGRQAGLFVALSWPDESPVHRDELATIFPTKVPEYLGTGRPILVHCPEDYYLARFFRERGCGLVVTERSEAALVEAWLRLRDDPDLAQRLGARGRATVSYFDGRRISAVFREHMEALVRRGAAG
jgi:hypothetical protein